jgi:hypothetical protein
MNLIIAAKNGITVHLSPHDGKCNEQLQMLDASTVLDVTHKLMQEFENATDASMKAEYKELFDIMSIEFVQRKNAGAYRHLHYFKKTSLN